jgi:hypothetical protein
MRLSDLPTDETRVPRFCARDLAVSILRLGWVKVVQGRLSYTQMLGRMTTRSALLDFCSLRLA